MILLEMMFEMVIGVMVMEVDKVANEVTDMEIDMQADDMVVNITMKNFLCDSGDWWLNLQLMQVTLPGGQISN